MFWINQYKNILEINRNIEFQPIDFISIMDNCNALTGFKKQKI